MKGYLYVVDQEGREIEGSRVSVTHCKTSAEVGRLKDTMQGQCADGCTVLDSEVDRRPVPDDDEKLVPVRAGRSSPNMRSDRAKPAGNSHSGELGADSRTGTPDVPLPPSWVSSRKAD